MSGLNSLYPSAAPAEPTPTAAAVIETPETPRAAAQPEQEQAPDAPEAAEVSAGALYLDPVETRDFVNWREPAATRAEDIKLDTSFIEHADNGPEGVAARAKLAEAFVAAGAGPTVARELFADAARAAKDTYKPVSAAAAEAELRQHWGPQYEAKIAGAAALVRKAAETDPSIVDFLERTGLGNDPKFIRKVANRIAAQSNRNK